LPPVERSAFLSLACRGDGDLRSRLDQLFTASARAANFLEDAPPFSAATGDPARVGPYTLGRPLGQGGMGEVWLAEQHEPIRRTVALKVVKAGMDSASVLYRFEQERQVLARMSHPNIAQVLDAGHTESGRPYFVMEFVDGLPIARYCHARELPLRSRLELFVQVCAAVQHAHQKGVIHRDLKPSNVLVAEIDGRPVPKVIDFGIAKAVGETPAEASPTVVGLGVLGTVEYMAPEQAEPGRPDVDTRADVYSLGAMLYELLAGHPPLSPDELRPIPFAEALRRVREEVPPRPSTRLAGSSTDAGLASTLRSELDWVVMKALEKDRDRRYATASELAADVQRFLVDEPVTARPPGRGYRLRKFVRRNRWPVAAAVLVGVAVVGGAGVATAGWVAATRAERTASDAQADAVEQRRVAVERADSAAQSAAEAKNASAAMRDILDHVRRNVFSAGRPLGVLGGRGRDLTLQQAIDAALPSIAKDFADRPTIEARVRHWIGQSYLALGELAPAVEQLRRAARLDEAHPPADPGDAHFVLVNLATAYLCDGRTADAKSLLAKTTPAAVAELGHEHPVALAARAAYGMAFDLDGRSAEAVELLESVAADYERLLGSGHPDTRFATSLLAVAYSRAGRERDADRLIQSISDDSNDLNGLCVAASAHQRAGRPDRAVELYRRVHPPCEAKLGPRHPSTLECTVALGGACIDAGRTAEGIEYLETVRARIDDALGRDHFLALLAPIHLAEGYLQTAQFRRATEVIEPVVPRCREKFGPAHPDTLAATTTLSNAYIRLERPNDAIELLGKTLPPAIAALGPKHPQVARAQTALAAALTRTDRPSKALELLNKVESDIKDTLPASHPMRMSVREQMAKAYDRLGRRDEALRVWRELVATQTAARGAHHPDILVATIGLASAYLRVGRPGDAVDLLEEAVPAFQAALGPKHPDVLNATSVLAAAYTMTGRQQEAAELIERVYPGYVEALGLRHRDTLTAAANLAHVYRQTGRVDRAADLLAKILPVCREVHGERHPDTLLVQSVLAISYTELGRPGEAALLLEEVVAIRKKELGPNNPSTVIASSNLALALDKARRKEALAALERVLPACMARLGPADISTLAVKEALAAALVRAGRHREAAALRDELLPVLRAKANHPSILRLLLARAKDYVSEGRPSDAATMAMEYLRHACDTHAKDARALAAARAAAGRVLMSVKDYAAAEPLLRDCLAAVRKDDRADEFVPAAESLLGSALLEQGKFAAAEPLLLSGYRGLEARSDPLTGPWPKPADAALRLADLYDALGKPDKAQIWRAKASEPATELGPPPRMVSR
jgi:serine/threonine protein kinase/tetratricopeptide (TPR) repeat protein